MADSAALGADQGGGWYYTRWGNPTIRLFEELMAELEGGEDALAAASGMGAIATAILSVLEPGSHAVSPRGVYQATFELFREIVPQHAVEVTLLDSVETEAYERAIRPNTRLVYLETPNNPLMQVTDITAVVALARRAGAVTICDNTFASPYNERRSRGCHLVVHSADPWWPSRSERRGVVGRRRIRRAVPCASSSRCSSFAAWLLVRSLRTIGSRGRHSQPRGGWQVPLRASPVEAGRYQG
jgi:cystathionine beta-lyase/cystathionine gamma-synthase